MNYSVDKNYIAESLSNCFSSLAVGISSEIPHTDVDVRDFLQDYNFTDTFFLPPLTSSSIEKKIILGKNLTACGHRENTVKMFKIIIEIISVPVPIIFN